MKPLLFIMAALALAGCASHSPAPAPVADRPPVAVKVERLEQRTWPVVKEAMGTVQARTRATVAAQVMGTIRQVRVEVGQAVRAGQVLVLLEALELHTALAQAEAARAEALSVQPEVEKAIEAARVQLELAESSHKRIAELFAKKSVSPQEMDESLSRVRAARAGVEMAQSRRGQIAARAETAAQAIASAKVMTGYTTVIAPFDGVVTEKIAQAGGLAAPGTPLLVLERAGGVELVITTEESEALRLGQPLTVVWEDGATLETKVTEIVPSIDAATRRQTVKAALPAIPGLRSGRFARARWTTGERSGLSIPAAALTQRGQLQMVLVVENGRLRSRMITAGQNVGGRHEVLTGLSAGELVVTQPPLEWTDGTRAQVQVQP